MLPTLTKCVLFPPLVFNGYTKTQHVNSFYMHLYLDFIVEFCMRQGREHKDWKLCFFYAKRRRMEEELLFLTMPCSSYFMVGDKPVITIWSPIVCRGGGHWAPPPFFSVSGRNASLLRMFWGCFGWNGIHSTPMRKVQHEGICHLKISKHYSNIALRANIWKFAPDDIPTLGGYLKRKLSN